MNTYTVTLEQATEITLIILGHNAQDAVHQARVTLNAAHLHESPATPLTLNSGVYTFTEFQDPEVQKLSPAMPFLKFQSVPTPLRTEEMVYLPVNELLAVWDVVRILPASTLGANFSVQGHVLTTPLESNVLCSNHPEVLVSSQKLPEPDRLQFHASRDDFWISFLTHKGWRDTPHITWSSIQHLEHDTLQLDPSQSSELHAFEVKLHCLATRRLLVAAHSENEAMQRAKGRPVAYPAPFTPKMDPQYSVEPTPGLHTYLGLYVNGPQTLDAKDQFLAIIPLQEVLSCFETIKPLPERLQSLEVMVQAGLVELDELQERPSCPEAAHLAILCSEQSLLTLHDTARCLMTHDRFRLFFSRRQTVQSSPRKQKQEAEASQTLLTFDVPWNDVETAMSDIRTVNYQMYVEK